MTQGPCSSCESKNIVYIYSDVASFCSIVLNNEVYQGEVPYDLNLGRGFGSIKILVCFNCGKIQGDWPINVSINDIRKRMTVNNDKLEKKIDKTKKKKR